MTYSYTQISQYSESQLAFRPCFLTTFPFPGATSAGDAGLGKRSAEKLHVSAAAQP